jgi:hypothetical protein
MSTSARSRILCSVFCLFLGTGLVLADDEKAEPQQPITAISDTAIARISKALATRDTSLIGSVLIEDISLVMPGDKVLSGRQAVMKYTPLLMERLGGSKLVTRRLQVDTIPEHPDIIREAGGLTLTRTDPEGEVFEWTGAYAIYWQLRDSVWVIERAFVSNR